jgi:hypothetical protein
VILAVLLGVFALIVVVPACLVCRKAGYPAWLGVAAILPVANIVLLCFLAFSKWPLEQRLEELARPLPSATPLLPLGRFGTWAGSTIRRLRGLP